MGSQITTQPIPTSNLDTHIEQQIILSKPTSVISQKAPVIRKGYLRTLPSSDSEDDDLTLVGINRKKQLKVAVVLSKPKQTSSVISQKTTDSDKGFSLSKGCSY